MNTAENGNIPQNRNRIYIIGFNEKIFQIIISLIVYYYYEMT